MALFRSLFAGRDDVYGVRWDNTRTGKSGWSPAVHGGWANQQAPDREYLPLTDDVVEAHLAALTTDAYLLDEYHVNASGGSSGRRGIFLYDRESWVITGVSFIRFSMRLQSQVLPPDAAPLVMATVTADKASHMTSAMAQTFTDPARAIHRLSATWPLER